MAEEAVKMNFDEAIVAHAEWKLKLTLYLQGDGKLDHKVVCQDNQCKLGKWIYSEGKKYSNEKAYEHLRAVHAQFHSTAAKVIKTVDDNNIELAKSMISADSEYSKISTTVMDAISSVKKRVEEKTNLIMANVNAGIMVIDRSYTVQSGYSQHCHDLFATTQVAGQDVCDLLGLDPRQKGHYHAIFEQLFDDIMPTEVSISMLPSRVRRSHSYLDMHINVIRSDGGAIDFILFTITDATRLAALEQESLENAALLKILRNRDAFIGFLRDAKTALDGMDVANQTITRREVHTIKGNCGMFDMNQLMSDIGKIEDHQTISMVDIQSIHTSLNEFAEKYRDIIGIDFTAHSEEIHSIGESELAQFEARFSQIKTAERARDFVQSMTARMRLRPARSVIGPVEERVHALGSRLQKEVICQVHGDQTLVNPKRLGPVIQVLSHALRNAVDHGIESAEERLDAGKAETGKIQIDFALANDLSLNVVITDDGRGIDTGRLVAKALKDGVITQAQAARMSQREKLELIFLDGVSTAEEVTDVSGRGVGMSALQAAVKSLGGAIAITSTLGTGTQLTITIPSEKTMMAMVSGF